jgi:hypothetical protein
MVVAAEEEEPGVDGLVSIEADRRQFTLVAACNEF